jgi:hypothetical protein
MSLLLEAKQKEMEKELAIFVAENEKVSLMLYNRDLGAGRLRDRN